MAFVMVDFGWRLWRHFSPRPTFPCSRIVEVFHLSVTLVVERIEFRKTAI